MTLFCFFCLVRILTAACLLTLLGIRDIRSRRLPARPIRLLAAASLLRIALLSPTPGQEAEALFSVFTDMVLGGAGTLLLLTGLTRLADRLTGRETLGGGDIRLAAALGLHLGFFPALLALLAASLLALPEALIRRRRGEFGFPFAPYLGAAGMVIMILQEGCG